MKYEDKLKSKDFYKLYVLWLNEKAIYVGVTTNINNRIRSHRLDKNFNKYSIIEMFENKKEAYSAERCIIKFMSVCGVDSLFKNATMPAEMIVQKHHIYKK